MTNNLNFRILVEELVATIPYGKVMTYGQIAALCGSPRSARIVGGIAHFSNQGLPWHRVVNKKGGLASGFHGGRPAQKSLLEEEGVKVDDADFIDRIGDYIWWPPSS
jgi:methylated-DNA-protein-cysteine methyltransferase-like protein